MSNSPLVSVVVLSYNRPRHLERALASLRAQTHPHLDVLVVDNRSEASDEIATVVARFPEVRLIAHAGNLGFTGGMNSGIAAAVGEYVYLTEDDIEVEPDCVRALVSYLDAHAEVGMVGPIMLNRGSGTVRCAGGHFSLGGTYRMTILGIGELPAREPGAAPYCVMYLPGAMFMSRASLFRDLAGFRDDFFMYVEDVEFCARVLKLGLSIAVIPIARVIHAEPEPGVSARIEFHKIKNLSALYLVHAPLGVLPTFVLRYGALGALRALVAGRFLVHLKAWAWTLAHAPRLLAERPRWRSSTARSGQRSMTMKAFAKRLAPQTAVEWHRRSRLVARARDLALRMAGAAEPHEWWALLEEFSEFRPIQRGTEFIKLMELVRSLEPVRLCEIGSASGGTLCALARAAQPDATLVTLDLEFSPERRAAFPDFRRGGQQIICIEGDSHDRATRERVREAFGDSPLDVLLIDGDHSYDGVRRDFELYSPLVRAGGLIVFHDIVKDFGQRFGTPTKASTGGVPDFWSEMKARHPDARELVEDPEQDGYGIGLIQGTSKRLNIGCGRKREVDAINLDISPNVGADVVHDLNQTPWPFDAGTFDEVHAYDVLEHVQDVMRTLEEIHRVCRPDATVHVTVPHFSSANAFTDLTHRHWFGWHSFDPFDAANDLSHYSCARFRRRYTRISFYKSVGNMLVPRLANRWPDAYERRWAWIFPAWFLYFQLEVLK